MKLRKWFETPLASKYGTKGLATILFAKRLAYLGHPGQPDNDRSHIKW